MAKQHYRPIDSIMHWISKKFIRLRLPSIPPTLGHGAASLQLALKNTQTEIADTNISNSNLIPSCFLDTHLEPEAYLVINFERCIPSN